MNAELGNDEDGTNLCTLAANPCASLDQAVRAAFNNDRISVDDGNYSSTGLEVEFVVNTTVAFVLITQLLGNQL